MISVISEFYIEEPVSGVFFLSISEHTKAHVQEPVLRSRECISSKCNHWIQT